MGRKVLVNILSLLTIVNLIFMTVQPPILQDMYSSYGLTDQIPGGTMFLMNNYRYFYNFGCFNIVMFDFL